MNPSEEKLILNRLKRQPYLKAVSDFARKRNREVYLVGGYLRDLYLGFSKDLIDFDFAVDKNSIKFSKEFARKIKGSFVLLDKEHGSSRIVLNRKGQSYTFDFTDFRGPTIEEDLLHRDFTINTLAVSLDELFTKKINEGVLIDLYKAKEDLKSKSINTVSDLSFKEDPLRILRAFSIAAVFGFKIMPKTVKEIKKYKAQITKVSSERVRDEIFKILSAQDSVAHLKSLDELGVLSRIIPKLDVMKGVDQGPYHHLDVWQHTLAALFELDKVFKSFAGNKDICAYLNTERTIGRPRKALIKFAALLHDIGKPKTKFIKDGKLCFWGHERVGKDMSRVIAEKIKLSNDERRALETIILWHLRPGYLADIKPLTERAIYRFFRDAKDEAASILLLAIADQRATRGSLSTPEMRKDHEAVAKKLLKRFFTKEIKKKKKRLITGDDLIKSLKLTPSPLFKKILEEIDEAQAVGSIKTKAKALRLARKIVKA